MCSLFSSVAQISSGDLSSVKIKKNGYFRYSGISKKKYTAMTKDLKVIVDRKKII
jgi:hypothetical protein